MSDDDSLLAMGGELSTERLVLAYDWGIFPWDTIHLDGESYIAWFSPKERFVIFPKEIKISDSMLRIRKQNKFEIRLNTNFEKVMRACAETERPNQEGGTWISEDVIEAYVKLHKKKRAMSVEVYENDELVGGLYGVISGKVFCGESMFSLKSNASKLALIWLAEEGGFELIDCQFHTPHLEKMGGRFIGLDDYLKILGREK